MVRAIFCNLLKILISVGAYRDTPLRTTMSIIIALGIDCGAMMMFPYMINKTVFARSPDHPNAAIVHGLQVIIEGEQSMYKRGEFIRVRIHFINKGPQRLDVVFYSSEGRVLFGEGLHFIITSEGGEKIEPLYPPLPKPPDILRIPLIQDSSWSFFATLREYTLTRSGTYTIQLQYAPTSEDYERTLQGRLKPDPWRWTGKILSNIITIDMQ
jgi:hypothetical protein